MDPAFREDVKKALGAAAAGSSDEEVEGETHTHTHATSTRSCYGPIRSGVCSNVMFNSFVVCACVVFVGY